MKSYATYVPGVPRSHGTPGPDVDGAQDTAAFEHGGARPRATNGLLTVDADGISFESFPEKSAIEQLIPALKREPDPKISWFYPRASIAAVTDLKGRVAPPPGLVGRVLRGLHVEPNGLIVRSTDGKTVIFDCAVSVYRLIEAYEHTTR